MVYLPEQLDYTIISYFLQKNANLERFSDLVIGTNLTDKDSLR